MMLLNDVQVNCYNCKHKRADHVNKKLYCFKGIINNNFPFCSKEEIKDCFIINPKIKDI